MHKTAKQSIIFILISILILMPLATTAAAQDQTPQDEASAEGIIVDLIILRPVGIVASVLGTALFIVALPFSGIGGNQQVVAKKLVKDPFAYTFKRPLGDF